MPQPQDLDAVTRRSARARLRQRITRFGLIVAGNLCVLILLLALIEGVASLALFARSARWLDPVTERKHTQYDPELGWVNIPNLRVADLYGPGAYFTTNSQGFRGKTDAAVEVPPGKVRAICSGDSFTLGFGVGDDETWCHLLTRLDPSIETVNMGQGGYGVDQAYLWYRRDGMKLDHNVHLFAFITDDFRRMRHDQFLGYGKPWISSDGKVRNVPVPVGSYGRLSWLARNAATLESLKSVQVAHGLAERLGLKRPGVIMGREVLSAAEQRLVLGAMIEDLDRHHRERGSRLVLVYLPTPHELISDRPTGWFYFFGEISSRLGIRFVNLFEPFASVGESAWPGLFINYPSPAGHYTGAGNRLVAELLLKELIPERASALPAIPRVSDRRASMNGTLIAPEGSGTTNPHGLDYR